MTVKISGEGVALSELSKGDAVALVIAGAYDGAGLHYGGGKWLNLGDYVLGGAEVHRIEVAPRPGDIIQDDDGDRFVCVDTDAFRVIQWSGGLIDDGDRIYTSDQLAQPIKVVLAGFPAEDE